MNANNPLGGQVFLSLNNGPATLFTVDTGSSGIIANKYIMPTTGLTSLGAGSQYYDSSGVLLTGDFYLTNVNIMSSQSTVATTATVVALLATNSTCVFTTKGCSSNSDPTPAYLGIGFDRGVSAITPPTPTGTNVNPFINVNMPSSSYSQGYIVTNSGVQLGLTNTSTANYAFVKLMPNGAAAGQQSAAWLQAPMTITVGGATGSGQVLPDSGISYAFLTPPTGANISTSACANPPGGSGCANPGLPVQVFLPGQTTPQLAFYNFATINGGTSSNPMTPDVMQLVPGTAVFLNTGRQFYQGFNYFFDPVNGYVGYQWTGAAGTQGGVIPIVALQGNVSFTNALTSSFPTYLMSNTALSATGSVVFQGSVFGPGGLAVNSGDIWLTNVANTYVGGTTINGGSLTLGPGATLPSAGALTVNGGLFNLNGNTQILSSLNGAGGALALGGGMLVLNTSQSNTLGSSLGGNGMFVVQGGGSLNLTGNSSGYSGSTTVSNASLGVNGSLGGNVFVGQGGIVSGNGNIVGHLFSGGAVAPGNSIGTLTVAGNFSQNAAGVYAAEVGGAGHERPHQCRRHGQSRRDGGRERIARHGLRPLDDLHHPQRCRRPLRHLRPGERALSLPAVEPELRRQQRLSQSGRSGASPPRRRHHNTPSAPCSTPTPPTPAATSPPCWAPWRSTRGTAQARQLHRRSPATTTPASRLRWSRAPSSS